MQKSILAVGIPSNRDLSSSQEAIESVLAYCKKSGAQMIVSDNSKDTVKEKELSRLIQGPGLHYIKSPPCGMIENWMTVFNATDREFILMMGDDDRMFSFSPPSDFSNVQRDVVGIRPCLFAYTDTEGFQKLNFSAIESASAPARIEEHIKTSAGNNMGIFSFWRRDVFKSIIDLWFTHHPTKGTYCDWAAMNGLVSSGKVIMDKSLCYFYNLQNWSGTAEHVQAQVERAFVSAGLPAGTAAYGSLLSAVDSLVFINRKDSPLAEQERGLSAIFCFNIYLQDYINNMPQSSAHINAKEIANVSKKLIGNDSVEDIFKTLAVIFNEIRPNLGTQYKEFFEHGTGKPWGTI